MVEMGDADAMLTGLTHHYPSALRPPLQVIGTADDADYAAGVYMLTFKNRVIFCADTTVNQDPDTDVLEEVTRHTGELARRFNVEPRAAMLSYSNFGSVDNPGTKKIRRAVSRLQDDDRVDFPVDGEMQADTAVVEDILQDTYEFSELDDPANVLVFPNLEAGNIGYKLLQRLGGAEAIADARRHGQAGPRPPARRRGQGYREPRGRRRRRRSTGVTDASVASVFRRRKTRCPRLSSPRSLRSREPRFSRSGVRVLRAHPS